MARKVRADVLVVERGLAETRTRAQALILAADVVASGGGAGDRRVDKPGQLLREDTELRLKGEGLKYVSRGGLKLEAALDRFVIDVTALSALDIGASTGGFSDCMLQRGAASVTAVDVGYGQLHEKLRQDPRVHSIERVNARSLPEDLGQFDLLVADVSFISLRLVVPGALTHVKPRGWIVLLVKPQFECGREAVGKGGVVRDPEARERAVRGVEELLAAERCEWVGRMESPILGPAGNVEFLVVARARSG